MGIHVVMLTGDNERTARAIGAEAGVDEVIAGVLPDGKESVIRKLKEQGKTIIVSTHIFSLVEKICDRVGIIINGQMTVCENLQTLCGEKSLEDRFFEIYEAVSGEETDHDK